MIYFARDIQTTDDGDIVLDNIGDVKVADPLRTVSQSINSILLTNKSDLLTDPLFGADIGKYYGERNTQATRSMIEQDIIMSIRDQGLIDPSSIEIDVIPIDVDKITIIASLNGVFFKPDSTGDYRHFTTTTDNDVTMAYLYPFNSNQITRVSND